jgi:hypothetical protein
MNIVGKLAILVDVVADIVMLRGETSGIPLAISLFGFLVPALVGASQGLIADESYEDPR